MNGTLTYSHALEIPSRGLALGRLFTSAALGIILHHLVFRKGEWHLRAPLIFNFWLASYPFLFLCELTLGTKSISGSAWSTALLLSCFTSTLFLSIVVYRLLFHRLSEFPGPRLAAVSKLWHSYQCLDGKNHLVLDKLRQKYGDFVRTGPNEITIFDPEALIRLDGPGNKTTKSVWYDFLMPDMGVTTIRDKTFHDKRRKIWTQAFSAKALPSYEQQMVQHAQELRDIIRSAANNKHSICFSSLAYWFSFDVMGMFALSESFDMLHNEEWHYAVTDLRRAMSILGPLSPVPWLAQVGFRLLKGYWVVKDWHSMLAWCRHRMNERIRINDTSVNIASFLINDAMKNGSLERDHHLLAGEAIVAIVAGSDTVAPTLVFIFYELARNPSMADKLYNELRSVDVDLCKALDGLPYLNSFIKETMRLHPAVPTGGYRDTPHGGMTIGGRYIPGNTTIVSPRYSIFRSDQCYERPDEFIPERWYSQPALVKDSRSYLPFAQGRYTCLGKGMALAELQMVIALLVSEFHIRFPEGDNKPRVEDDFRDQFTAAPGQLDLVFLPRT